MVQVQLKECTAGQAVLRGRRPDLYAGCTNCTNPLFSFDPTASQCSTCPPPGTYKVCSGDVLTPAIQRLGDAYGRGEVFLPQMMVAAGLIKSLKKPVKVLSAGEIHSPLLIKANKFSQTAKRKIEAAGGTAVEIEESKEKAMRG